MKKLIFLGLALAISIVSFAQKDSTVKKKDRKSDVELVTDKGVIVLRLSDSTPLHRDNFLRLVKVGFYDGLLFHRVMQNFMVQGGDPVSKTAEKGVALGSGSSGYTIPKEFIPSLFHKKGALAAARTPDNVNPEKASSGSQFYIVHGKTFTDAGLDSVETFRMNGQKLNLQHREVYKSIGGAPHLDKNYTVFGEVVKGLDVVDMIAAEKVDMRNRPLDNVKIIKAQLIKRKKLK